MQEVLVPKINSDELLVKVEAFGVGVHDCYFIPPNVNFPYPIGTENAGIIVDKGSDVASFHKSERVILSSK